MKLVYIAGPYSGDTITTLHNIRRGIQADYAVVKAGFAPYTPWFDFLRAFVEPTKGEVTREQYQAVSMAFMERADAVLLVEGWEKSAGVKRELARASEMGIPVFEDLRELIAWDRATANNTEEAAS